MLFSALRLSVPPLAAFRPPFPDLQRIHLRPVHAHSSGAPYPTATSVAATSLRPVSTQASNSSSGSATMGKTAVIWFRKARIAGRTLILAETPARCQTGAATAAAACPVGWPPPPAAATLPAGAAPARQPRPAGSRQGCGPLVPHLHPGPLVPQAGQVGRAGEAGPAGKRGGRRHAGMCWRGGAKRPAEAG